MGTADLSLSDTMKVRALNSSNSSAERLFFPGDYFLGIAYQAMQDGKDIRVVLPGKGDIVLLPSHGKFYTDVINLEEFCRTPSSQLQTFLLNETEISAIQAKGKGRPIRLILWEAGFHASKGRLVMSNVFGAQVHEFDVVRIMQWPNLSRLPTTPNTMRIISMLIKRPSAISLVHRKLHIDLSEWYQNYSAACSAGYVDVVSSYLAQNEEPQEESQSPKEHSLLGSLFAKIRGL